MPTTLTNTVVDDGSSDATQACVAAFTDPRIRYISMAVNVGKSAAANAAAQAALGEWLMFADSDDRSRPERLALQLNATEEQSSVDGVFARTVFVDDDEQTTEHCFPAVERDISGPIALSDLLHHSPVGGGSLLVRRSAFNRIGGFDERLRKAEDLDFAIRFVQRFLLIGQNEIIIECRISADGMTQNPNPVSLSRLIERHQHLYRAHAPKRLAYLYREAGDEFQQIGNHRAASCLYRRALYLRPNRVNCDRLINASSHRWVLRWPIRALARILKLYRRSI